MASGIALQARGIGKSFAGTVALADVDLELRAGEMLALVGANGAGKSTLVKIICGAQPADTGDILVDGRVVRFASVADALAAGIGVAHQQVAIIPRLNGAQNIMLGREPLNGAFIRAKTLKREAQAIAQRFGVEIDLTRECSELGLGETKILDILKALANEPSILILDEPTASLTLKETRRLFAFLADLKAQGLAIVFISHHLNEVFEHCDRVTVLKDGRRVYDGPVAALSRAELVHLMVGRAIEDTDWQSHAAAGDVVVSVRDARIATLDVPEFSVHRGEVVGVAGVLGAGQTEFLERLAGVAHPTRAGAAQVGTLPHLPTSVKQAVENAIYLIADNRLRNAIFPSLSVEENLMTGSLGLVSSRGGIMNKRRGGSVARGLIEQLRIKCSGGGQNVMQLSGGNQQKVAFGRWISRLERTPKSAQPVFLLDNPTEGVDVGSKAELYGIIRDFARNGGAVVISSSEFAELQKLCDRVYSIARGTLGKPLTRTDITEDRLLLEVS